MTDTQRARLAVEIAYREARERGDGAEAARLWAALTGKGEPARRSKPRASDFTGMARDLDRINDVLRGRPARVARPVVTAADLDRYFDAQDGFAAFGAE